MSPEIRNESKSVVDKFFAEFNTHTLPHEKEWCLRQYIDKAPKKMLGNIKVQALMVGSILNFYTEVVNHPDAKIKDTFVKYIVEDLIPQFPKNSRKNTFDFLGNIQVCSKDPKINYIQEKLDSLYESLI